MYTIKLEVNDKFYDKIMTFLKNIPVKNIIVEKKADKKQKNEKNDIVSFFQSSPIVGEISLERDKQNYIDRVNF